MTENNNEEMLLPIHRQFTDKEKHDWMHREYKVLEVKHKALIFSNKKVISKNKILLKVIAEHEAEIPSVIHKNQATVTVKTFLKLRKQYNIMVENFWRVNDELLELKKNLQAEKL